MPEFEIVPMSDLKGYIKEEQVQQLYGAIKGTAKGLMVKLILSLLWVTGCRISELVGDPYNIEDGVMVFRGLTVNNIIWDEGVIILDTLKRKARKYGEYPVKQRRITVPKWVMDMLKEHVDARSFKGEDRVFPVSRQWVYYRLRDLAKKIGIEKIGDGKHWFHPHVFRHSHSINWIKNKNTMEDLKKLQQRLDHVFITTTAYYLQFAVEESRKEIEEVFGEL